MTNSLNVAVIGAGVSGLLAARELLRENHQVTVFEKSNRVGGTWVYDPQIEADDDVFRLNPNRSVVHSSLYSSLRTNLPRPLMGFSDYSFEDKSYGDSRIFPGHEEVQKFLQDFATEFRITEVIRFDSEVVRVESTDGGFVVEVGSAAEEFFDAVVVCNGHHSEPRFADDIPGIKEWSRKQVHSHNYRVPEPYQDQVVVVIGSGPSALDISREIATVAKEVHLSSRSSNVKASKLDGYENMWQHLKINNVFNDGMVVFDDGCSIEADSILHCTGYKFHFPFLRSNNMVDVDDNRVGPLYKHVFPPQLAPRLSFIGLTYSTKLVFHLLFLKSSLHLKTYITFHCCYRYEGGILFRMFELQSKWVALVLSGKILLPSKDEMLADVHKHYREMEENGIPKRYTHSLRFQFDYIDWLADQVGLRVEDRLKKLTRNIFELVMTNFSGLRDDFVEQSMIID